MPLSVKRGTADLSGSCAPWPWAHGDFSPMSFGYSRCTRQEKLGSLVTDSNEDLRGRLADASRADNPSEGLRAELKVLLNEGCSTDELLEQLEVVRARVDDSAKDAVLDAMDLLVGWCAPDQRLA